MQNSNPAQKPTDEQNKGSAQNQNQNQPAKPAQGGGMSSAAGQSNQDNQQKTPEGKEHNDSSQPEKTDAKR